MKLLGTIIDPSGTPKWEVFDGPQDSNVTVRADGSNDVYACLGDLLESLGPGYAFKAVGLDFLQRWHKGAIKQ